MMRSLLESGIRLKTGHMRSPELDNPTGTNLPHSTDERASLCFEQFGGRLLLNCVLNYEEGMYGLGPQLYEDSRLHTMSGVPPST